MKKQRSRVLRAIVGLCVLMLLGACAGSYQARSVDVKNSPLVNPSIFKEGTSDQALYRYMKPGLDVTQYTKAIIDPVMFSKDGDMSQGELSDYQTLANNAYVYLSQELKKYVTIVKTPQPGTMRIQWAIIDADSSKPVRNTLSTVFPIAVGLSVVKVAATGKQSGVGEITTEMKFTDAATGELLGASLDRRVGGKEITELWSSWYNADEALKYWAKRVAFVLCTEKKMQGCVNP
jgi:hypothetical protein